MIIFNLWGHKCYSWRSTCFCVQMYVQYVPCTSLVWFMTVTFCCHMILYLESGNAFQQRHMVLERCALVRLFSIRHNLSYGPHWDTKPRGQGILIMLFINDPSIVSRATFNVTQHRCMLICCGCAGRTLWHISKFSKRGTEIDSKRKSKIQTVAKQSGIPSECKWLQ